MTKLYRLKQTDVDAVEFHGQPLTELPDWAQQYRHYTPFNGVCGIAMFNDNQLHVPATSGYVGCRHSDWLVWDGKTVTVATSREFADLYELIVQESAPEPNAAA